MKLCARIRRLSLFYDYTQRGGGAKRLLFKNWLVLPRHNKDNPPKEGATRPPAVEKFSPLCCMRQKFKNKI